MEFRSKDELIKEARKLNACEVALEWAEKQPDLETILRDCCREWRIWCLKKGFVQFINYSYNLKNSDWIWLLVYYPQYEYEKYCDWSRFDGADWCFLLSHRPEFAKHCDWNLLDDMLDWYFLLREQPQFVKYCPEHFWRFLIDNIFGDF